jgi:DNA invertase Pin-like site-specific DNA recombinase
MQTAIYVRAADAPDQVENRLADLRDTATDRGCAIIDVFIDRITGTTKCRKRLPGLAALMNSVSRHEVDILMVWSICHLGTSLDDLLDTLTELHRYGVKLVVHDQADEVATVETGGLLVAAELLVGARRAYRREGVIAGQMRAKAVGVRFGRPPVAPARIEKVQLALRSGQGVRQAARSIGISAAKVSRIRAEMVGAGMMG